MTSTVIPQNTLEQITTHLVFPRELPSSSHQHEATLVRLILETLKTINELPSTTMKLLQCFQKLHPLVDATTIADELKKLEPGEMLGMYVRKQNSCLVVYHAPKMQPSQSPNEYVVSTFPVKLDKKDIYGFESDIQVKKRFFFRCISVAQIQY